jgi:glycosyltransferase involved in cell wall biosynthesis
MGRLNDFITFPAFVNPIWWRAAISAGRQSSAKIIIVRDLPLAPVGLLAGRHLGIPVVMDMAESYPEMIRNVWTFAPWKLRNVLLRNPWLAGLVERYVIKRLDHILVVVEESRDRLVALGVPAERITIVSNTPDAARFGSAPAPTSGEELRLSYIGLLGFSRGLEVAIRGIAQFLAAGGKATLEIHGTGAAEQQLRALVRKLALEETVLFRGWLDNTRVPDVLAATDVGVVPHRRCGHWDTTIPNKLFDYMASARPVLVSDAPPMRRIIERARCGLVFRDNDPGDFARALAVLSESSVRAELGANGRLAITAGMNWSEDGSRLTRTIDAELARRPAR